MTLPPILDTVHVRGVAGPEYQVGPMCANPECRRYADHAHHIFRRSMLGGAYAWVEIRGYVLQNLTGLCHNCHDKVTGNVGGHKAAIRAMGEEYAWTWMWCNVLDYENGSVDYDPIGPIEPQPLTPEEFASSRASGPSEESTACPTCGHVKRARPIPGRPGRARKSWTILVPNDAEDGAEILDTLVEDMALLLGIEPNQTGRYFIVLPCLYFAHQSKAEFIANLKGVGG